MRSTKLTETILFSIIFLFFLQSLTDFIAAIYAFGLLELEFTIEVASIVLLFTPLVLLLFRKAPSKSFLFGLVVVAIAARLMEPMLAPSARLFACGISVGAFMLLFPLLLQHCAEMRGWGVTNGLLLALVLSIFLKTAHSSLDLSESGVFQVIGWLLGIIAILLFWRADLSATNNLSSGKAAAGWRMTGLAIGLTSVILLMYFAFANPVVIARWTGFSYPVVLIPLVAVLTIFGFLLRSESFTIRLTRRVVLGWNVLFLLMLVLTILPHQITFPPDPEAYPLDTPAVSPLAGIFLFLMLVLSPVIFIDFALFIREISTEKPSLPQLGGSFATAALFLLVMVFFHVFTTIYDYAPVIGPLFRDRFWFIYLLAGLGTGLPLLLLRRRSFSLEKAEPTDSFTPLVLGLLAILSIATFYLTTAKPVAPQGTTSLKIMTYNIQQGIDAEGNRNLEAQLAVIKSVDPDILGLEEWETARVANGNIDAVRYFADRLDMYAYYGPTVTTGTFGVALLSKYPIQNPETFFMYSIGEQTATVHAEIVKGDRTYHVFVTHLGNGGPIFQLEQMLTRIQGLDNVITMGDFNFEPTTDQYAIMTRTLDDSWLLKWQGGKDIPGLPSDERIDHIFVSPGTTVLTSEYGTNPASDHPYLYTVIEP